MPWKQLYSYSFGMYAAAAVAEATGDRDAWNWANRRFNGWTSMLTTPSTAGTSSI